ncbi:hypothetical protein V3C99_017413 [Haemonchus contortus]
MKELEEALPKTGDKWKCFICKIQFDSRVNLENHLVACILGPYEACEQCFNRKNFLQQLDHVWEDHKYPTYNTNRSE